jgi:hypothetical protein
MNEPRTTLHLDEQARTPSERLGLEIGLLAGRLAELLRNRFVNDPSPVASALEFLDHAFHSVSGNALERQVDGQWHPIERLAYGFALSPFEVDLLLLAGLAEEHEGYADIFRTLHPLARPRPTTGLAAQLFSRTGQERFALRDLLETGSCMSFDVLRLEGDGPLFTRDLILAEQLWSVLHGIDAWPSAIIRSDTPAAMHGLDEWLRQPSVVKAQRALQQGRGSSIIVSADDEETAFQRADHAPSRTQPRTRRAHPGARHGPRCGTHSAGAPWRWSATHGSSGVCTLPRPSGDLHARRRGGELTAPLDQHHIRALELYGLARDVE